MKRVMNFYRTFFQTLSLKSYEGFADSTNKNTFSYYASLVFNGFVLMLIVMLPALVQLPSNVESQFNHIERFNFDIDFKTSSPILIPKDNPVVMISYGNETPDQPAKVILNNNVLYFGFLFNKYSKDFSIYKDAKQNKSAVSNIIAVILLLMLPTLLLIFFFYLAIKYFVIALIAAGLTYLLAPAFRYKIGFKQLFNTAMYGISLTVFLDLIFFALGFSFYYIQYLPLAINMISGLIVNGDKVDKKMKGRFLDIKG